jgi:dethiobiotin synthetase
MQSGVFITGTDTGVGKTFVSVALLRALCAAGVQAVGMKPVASGCLQTPAGLRNEDALKLQAAGCTPVAYERINPYAFEPPVSPDIAARAAGHTIELGHIVEAYRELERDFPFVLVEGVGGWMVPINETQTMLDCARALELPVVLVVSIKLGCINHALLSAAAIATSGLRLTGWIANVFEPEPGPVDEIIATINAHINARQLGTVGAAATGAPDISINIDLDPFLA